MKRFSFNIDDDLLQGVRACSKAEGRSIEKVITQALCSYLQGFELLILDGVTTSHNSHREALTAMAGAADWHASGDLENRSFTGMKDGREISARIVRVEVPR